MTCPGYRRPPWRGQDAEHGRALLMTWVRRRCDAYRRLAATGQLPPILTRQLQRFDVNAGHCAAGDHQPADRAQQRVVADEGRDGRDSAVPMLVAQPQRLDRSAGVDGRLEHRRIERPRALVDWPALGPLARPASPGRARPDLAGQAAPGGALRKRHHRMTCVEARGDGGDHGGQLPQTGPLDRDDPTMRAIIRTATLTATSARATNDTGDARHRLDGSTAPIVRMSSHDMWSLTTSTPGRLRIGPPDTVIRTPRHHSSSRQ